MSYIGEPFKYDICVSYSHGADGSGASQLKRYSQGLIRELITELRAHPTYGRELSLFFDDNDKPGEGLDPNRGLTEQLRPDMGLSALFTVLMSDQYLRSTWCADERDFWQKQQTSLGLTYEQRIALARIWKTTETWPPFLTDERGNPLVGIPFYDESHADASPWPYNWPEPGPSSMGDFRERLLKLVGCLWRQIEQMKARMRERAAAQKYAANLSEAPERQVLYVHARNEQAGQWTEARKILKAEGFTIFPTAPEAVDADPKKLQQQRRERVQTLSGCDALLLLTSPDGGALDADLLTIGRWDRQSARALSNRPLPCAVLDSAGDGAAVPERKDVARDLGVDWLDATHPPWSPAVRDWLKQQGAAAEKSL